MSNVRKVHWCGLGIRTIENGYRLRYVASRDVDYQETLTLARTLCQLFEKDGVLGRCAWAIEDEHLRRVDEERTGKLVVLREQYRAQCCLGCG